MLPLITIKIAATAGACFVYNRQQRTRYHSHGGYSCLTGRSRSLRGGNHLYWKGGPGQLKALNEKRRMIVPERLDIIKKRTICFSGSITEETLIFHLKKPNPLRRGDGKQRSSVKTTELPKVAPRTSSAHRQPCKDSSLATSHEGHCSHHSYSSSYEIRS